MNTKLDLVASIWHNGKKPLSGQNTFFREVARVSEAHNEKIQDAAWTALNDKLFLIYQKLQILRAEVEKLQRELPVQRYTLFKPFSAKCYWLFSLVALIGIESMSWMNAAYFAKETLGDDRYWGALTMSLPIVMMPLALNFFADKMPEYESTIRKCLFVIFAISAIGWFAQFGSKFATIDSAQQSFSVNWDATSASTQPKEPPVSYRAYLAFQLILECLGSYVAARKLAKYSGPQLDIQFERITGDIEKNERAIAILHAQEAFLKFHRNKLQEEMVSRRCPAENNYKSLSQ